MTEVNLFNAVLLCLGGVAVWNLLKFFNYRRKQATWAKWEALSKHKVILHGMFGGRKLPSPSPFVLKVETWLRLAKIPYEVDKLDMWGPKGKTPWVSVNGHNISDSQFIIEFLGKKFDKQFDSSYSEEQRAIGTTVRIMMEEYMYWGGILWRFAYGGRDTFEKVRNGDITLGEYLIFKMIGPSLISAAYTQGLGRHSEAEIIEIMTNCLKSLSKLLGKKPFLLGNDPCEVDCCTFGQLASVVFMDDSPFKQLLQNDLRNLKEYCIRMKEEYWPDWNELLIH